jgi:uncharacterized protein YneF (UPF0154 family)
MEILLWIALSIIAGLAFGKFVSSKQELDAHEQMTIANYDNRDHWDM